MRKRASHIAKTFGVRHAAGYLRNQGVGLRLSLYELLGIREERQVFDNSGRRLSQIELDDLNRRLRSYATRNSRKS